MRNSGVSIVAAVLLLLCGMIHTVCCFDASQYPLKYQLDKEGKFTIHWKLLEDKIQFAMVGKTSGWLGLGVSKSGQMIADSDMVLGWVADGKTQLSDRNTRGFTVRKMPAIDENQDSVLIAGEEGNGTTIIEFQRPYSLCDPEDNPITKGTTRLIWAMSSADPASADSVQFHDAGYGSVSINLRALAPEDLVTPSGAQFIDLMKSKAVVNTGLGTLYHCSAFKVPKADKKTHLIAFEPVLAAATARNVHHMLFYVCSALSAAELAWSGDCYHDRSIPPALENCNNGMVLAGWAVGGGLFSYPAEAGLPFHSTTDDLYVLLETHYTVSDQKGITDSSGMRFYYTENLRPNDAGILSVGADLFSIAIPRDRVHKQTFVCPGECTKAGLPASGVTVFGNMLHGHTTARKIATRIVRNGKEIAPLNRDDSYDFNYQTFNHITPFKLLRGDTLYTECTYDTTGRSATVWGGLSTSDEMCLSFVMYYPAIPVSSCHDSLDYEAFFTSMALQLAASTGKSIDAIGDALGKAFSSDDNEQRNKILAASGIDFAGKQGDMLIGILDSVLHKPDCLQNKAYDPTFTADPYVDPQACPVAEDKATVSSSGSASVSLAVFSAIVAFVAFVFSL